MLSTAFYVGSCRHAGNYFGLLAKAASLPLRNRNFLTVQHRFPLILDCRKNQLCSGGFVSAAGFERYSALM